MSKTHLDRPPKAPDRVKMAVAAVKNSVTSDRFRFLNSTLPAQTISTFKICAHQVVPYLNVVDS
ncbi:MULTISPECIES: hypothetical protein [Microcoleaceae]|uniref:hypothetical protein n=1 Tax=Microcoleaceae TaxID=1892252 RepID=UPI0018827DB0|nr:hypothetical protein [Tychonema sp. LEGE 06208]MBE9161123.1 hypothetical protein [Tychonema sp. LEGE 06208]